MTLKKASVPHTQHTPGCAAEPPPKQHSSPRCPRNADSMLFSYPTIGCPFCELPGHMPARNHRPGMMEAALNSQEYQPRRKSTEESTYSLCYVYLHTCIFTCKKVAHLLSQVIAPEERNTTSPSDQERHSNYSQSLKPPSLTEQRPGFLEVWEHMINQNQTESRPRDSPTSNPRLFPDLVCRPLLYMVMLFSMFSSKTQTS